MAQRVVRLVVALIVFVVAAYAATLAFGRFDTPPDPETFINQVTADSFAVILAIAGIAAAVAWFAVEYLQTRRLASLEGQFTTRTFVLMPIGIALNIVLGAAVAQRAEDPDLPRLDRHDPGRRAVRPDRGRGDRRRSRTSCGRTSSRRRSSTARRRVRDRRRGHRHHRRASPGAPGSCARARTADVRGWRRRRDHGRPDPRAVLPRLPRLRGDHRRRRRSPRRRRPVFFVARLAGARRSSSAPSSASSRCCSSGATSPRRTWWSPASSPGSSPR